jgi:hypothetical protein
LLAGLREAQNNGVLQFRICGLTVGFRNALRTSASGTRPIAAKVQPAGECLIRFTNAWNALISSGIRDYYVFKQFQ